MATENRSRTGHTHQTEKRRKKGNRTARFIISTLLGFVLTIVLTAMTWMAGLYMGFFNEGLILDHLGKNNYYNGVLEYTYDSGESIALPIGLSAEVFEGSITLDMVYHDVRGYMEAAFDQRAYTIDTKELQENLAGNIAAYMEQKGITLTEEQQANVQGFTEQVADDYVKNVTIPFMGAFVKARNLYAKVLAIALPVLAACALFLGVFLFRLYRFKHKALRFISYSAIATGMMSIVLPSAALLTRFYERLHVSPKYFYEFVSTYVSQGILVFIYLGIAWFVAAACTIILTGILRRRVA